MSEATEPRASMNPMAALSWSLAPEIAMYERIGTTHIGLSAAKAAALGTQAVVDGLAGSAAHVEYLCHGITSRVDGKEYTRELNLVWQALRMAADLGADTVYVTTGPSGGLSWEQAADALAEHLAPVVRHASELGVALAIENTMSIRSDLSFTHSLRDTAALARRLGAGLCVDLYCCWSEAGLLDTFRDNLDLVRLVQVSDFRMGTLSVPNRWVPGDGDLPLDRLLTGVLEAGYRGPVDLELLGPAIETEGAESALRRGLDWLNDRLPGRQDTRVDGRGIRP